MHAKSKPAVKKPEPSSVKLLATPHMYRTAQPCKPVVCGVSLRSMFLVEAAQGCYCTQNGYTERQCKVLSEAAAALQHEDFKVWMRYITLHIDRVARVFNISYDEAQARLQTDFAFCLAWISRLIFGEEPWLQQVFAGKSGLQAA